MLRPLIAILAVAVAIMGTSASEAQPETKKVTLFQGVVEGVRESTGGDTGRFFYSFRGIPYASPPVGDLRFKDPEAAETWSDVRKSVKPPACLQPDFAAFFQGRTETMGEEDCLYLNVYTPMPSEDESLLPVMVFIHGGGFSAGDAELSGGASPAPLLKHGIILVSIQYRLGTLGFMSTGDSAIPGNFGLKDQTFALKWVQENIRKFGGNPERVTIFGESAGSASVHFHVVSPYSKGLFQGAIMQSGTVLNIWAVREDHAERALIAARKFGCPGTEESAIDTNQIAKCLKEQSVDDLVSIVDIETFMSMKMYMVPRVDGDYIPAHPAKLLKDGEYNKVDIIAGVCQNEGAGLLQMYCGNETLVNNFPSFFDNIVPDFAFIGHEDKAYLSRLAVYHYTGDLALNNETAAGYEKFFSDAFMNAGHDESTIIHGRDIIYGHRTYRFELQHRPEISFGDVHGSSNVVLQGEKKWVAHGDDLQFFFNGVFGLPTSTRADMTFLTDIMTTLWVNFAKTGNPTPDLKLGFKWKPMESANDLRYLSLTPSPKMKKDDRAEVRKFNHS